MSAAIGIAVMIYACYKAYINYQLFSEANKEYGPFASKTKTLPNYGLYTWGWGALALTSALFSGVIG